MEPRIGNAEREAATALLGDHFAQGRLEHEEYDERLDAVWSSRTRADLDQVFWDLPRPVVAAPSRPVRPARRRIPLIVLVLAALGALALVSEAPWLLLIAAAWFLLFRSGRRHTRAWHGGQVRGCR